MLGEVDTMWRFFYVVLLVAPKKHVLFWHGFCKFC